MKQNGIYVLIALVVAAIIFMQPLPFASNNPFTTSDTVYIPQYSRMSCEEIDGEDMELKTHSGHTDDPVIYHCVSGASLERSQYIPQGTQCEFTFEDVSESLTEIYVCEDYTTDIQVAKNTCNEISSSSWLNYYTDDGVVGTVTVPAGGSVYMDTVNFLWAFQPNKQSVLKYRIPSYGLEIIQGTNFGVQTPSCRLSSLGPEYETIESQGIDPIPLDQFINVVSGLTPAIPLAVISIPEIRSGEDIYVTGYNKYQLIKETDEGTRYVDTTRTYNSARIECVPGSLACSDDARAIDIDQQPCDEIGGTIIGYVPVGGGEYCAYECKDGINQRTNNCIDENKCADNQRLNTYTGKCETLKGPDEETKFEFDFFILGMIGMSLVAAYLFIDTIRRRKR